MLFCERLPCDVVVDTGEQNYVEDENAEELEDMIKTNKSLWGLSSKEGSDGVAADRRGQTALLLTCALKGFVLYRSTFGATPPR